MRLQPVLPLLGPSGAGKSSFVQAGVIPRLREQEDWVVLQLRPGPRPFDTLATRLERSDTGTHSAATTERNKPSFKPRMRAERLAAEPRQLSIELRSIAEAKNAKVLLFVDQLEELFTLV